MRRVVSRGNDGCHTRHHLTGEQQKKKTNGAAEIIFRDSTVLKKRFSS
jgi:hypothetical protein